MIKQIISFIYRTLFNIVTAIFPVNKKIVLFESFNGNIPSDNPLAIYNAMVQDEEFADWNLYWGIKKANLLEAKAMYPEMNFLSRYSMKWLWIASRAGFWVFNARMSNWFKKNKQTVYFQTWHGTPLKKLGLDIKNVVMPGTNTKSYQDSFIKESKRWDYLVAPNEYSKEIFKHAFAFENNFLDIGYPRNDRLVQANNEFIVSQLKKELLGEKRGNVFLYAPTWRDDYFISKGNYKFNMPFKLEKMIQLLDKEDLLIIRPHYLVKDSIDIEGYENQVRVCVDEDINDLFLIADCLITDYSSVMFDFAILKKPMIFYAYDLVHYENEVRGFYFDYDSLPGPICKDETSFYHAIKSFYTETSKKNLNDKKYLEFYNKFCSWENGEASLKVAELIKVSN